MSALEKMSVFEIWAYRNRTKSLSTGKKLTLTLMFEYFSDNDKSLSAGYHESIQTDQS